MSHYKRILVGLDLSAESQQVIDHVKALFAGKDSKISLVHVQEPLSFAYGGDIPMDLSEIQNQLETQATQRLAHLRRQQAAFALDTHVLLGQPASENAL